MGRNDDAVSARAAAVTGNYFDILQVRAYRRRFIDEQDDNASSIGNAVVLSYRCWRDLYDTRDEALGTNLLVNGVAYTVIGVASPEFTGIDTDYSALPDIWIPLSRATHTDPMLRTMMSDITSTPLRVFGRLNAGTSVFQAREQMKAIATQLGSGKSQVIGSHKIGSRTFTDYWEKPLPNVELIANVRQQVFRTLSVAVFGLIGIVLVLIGGNVTALLLVRTETQCRAFAIRTALGASKWQVARGTLVESFMVSALGAVAGLGLAFWFLRLVIALTPEEMRWHKTMVTGVFDGRILGFGFVIAALLSIGFSLVPIARIVSINTSLAMQLSTPNGANDRTSTTFRSVLTILETAASVLLLSCVLSLLQTIWSQSKAALTFNAERVSTIIWGSHNLEVTRNWGAMTSFQNAFIEQVKNLHGVQAAALCSPCWPGSPIADEMPRDLYIPTAITPDYFKVVNISILRGHDFTNLGSGVIPLEGIVNQRMARQLWPNENPIGQRLEHIRFFNATVEIVGIVGDTREEGVGYPEVPILYLPLHQITYQLKAFPLIRTERDPQELLPAIRSAANGLNSSFAILKIPTVAENLAVETQRQKLVALILVGFASITVTFTGIGLYGLLSYIASMQSQELCVRLALGAPRNSVLRLMLKRGVALAVLGTILGIVAEAAFGNILSNALDGVRTHDIPTLGLASLVMCCVSIAGSWVPSWRASRLDPAEVLHRE
jgi:predicted permease